MVSREDLTVSEEFAGMTEGQEWALESGIEPDQTPEDIMDMGKRAPSSLRGRQSVYRGRLEELTLSN